VGQGGRGNALFKPLSLDFASLELFICRPTILWLSDMSTKALSEATEYDGLVEFTLTEIKRSKIITVSAKIAQPEFLALERLSQACHVSKSTIIREALKRYLADLLVKNSNLSSVISPEAVAELNNEDGSAAAVEKCLKSLSSIRGP